MTSMGTLYIALDGYENEARQRKYKIAVCEDTIGNLKTALAQLAETNKDLESEVHRLDMEATACETNYEKKLKEKELIENEYHVLAKEMDQVSEDICKKQTQKQKIEEFHKEKLELIFKTEDHYMAEYMKNPKTAEMFENRKKTAELETQMQEKSEELQAVEDELRTINICFSEEWPVFVKKCVKIAEIRAEITQKLKTRNQLRKRLENAIKLNGFSSLRVQMTLDRISPVRAGDQDSYHQRSGYPSRNGSSLPKPKRSLTFQHMDRILSQSILRESGDNRKIFKGNPSENVRKYIPMATTLRSSGSSLVSQLKSRLKGTVLVNPMPRNPDPPSIPTSQKPQPFQHRTVAVVPSRNEENEHCSLSQQSQALAYFPPATLEARAPTAMPPGENASLPKSQSMEIDDPNENDKALHDKNMEQQQDCRIDNHPTQAPPVGGPYSMSFPQSQGHMGIPGSPLKRIPNPQPSFLQPSSPAISEFNFFGSGFNMGGQSPGPTGSTPGGGYDIFGGFFSDQPSSGTQQSSSTNDFFPF